MSKKGIIIYVLVSFGTAYFIDILIYYLLQSISGSIALFMLGLRMFTPLLAVIIIPIVEGESIIDSLKMYGSRLCSIKYIIAALLIPFLIYGLTIFYSIIIGVGITDPIIRLYNVTRNTTGIKDFDTTPILLVSLLSAIILGPTLNAFFAYGEEIGWRGYLLDMLLEKHGFYISNIFIGIIWSLWHAPLIILFGYNYPHHPDALGMAVYTVLLIILSMILSYLKIISRSIIPPSILHGTFNALASLILLTIPLEDEIYSSPQGLLGIISCLTILMMIHVVKCIKKSIHTTNGLFEQGSIFYYFSRYCKS